MARAPAMTRPDDDIEAIVEQMANDLGGFGMKTVAHMEAAFDTSTEFVDACHDAYVDGDTDALEQVPGIGERYAGKVARWAGREWGWDAETFTAEPEGEPAELDVEAFVEEAVEESDGYEQAPPISTAADKLPADEDGEWEPETAELRDPAERDISAHAARNIGQIRQAEADGELEPDDADRIEESIREADREHPTTECWGCETTVRAKGDYGRLGPTCPECGQPTHDPKHLRPDSGGGL